jgi:hypothetical protein
MFILFSRASAADSSQFKRLLLWVLVCGLGFLSVGRSAAAEGSAVNVALGRPVATSGPTWNGLVASALTDGNPATFSHPLASSGTLNYFFQVDLGRSYNLERILIRNRNDGCCPERLTRYGVEIYSGAGDVVGTLNWSATIRANNSNSGVGGVDTIVATNSPNGNFQGRFIRIVNRNSAAYSPQLAEVEVYGTQPPIVRLLESDDDTLTAGQSTTLRWELINATTATLSPGIGPIAPTNGSITIQPSATTVYTLTASNEAGIVTASLPIGVNVELAPPQITEFMASNGGQLSDEDGDKSDWIELHNPNPYSLKLGGYSLTDNPTNLTQWTLPNARIKPYGFLIVYASDKNRVDLAGELHTNFKLDAGGDYLALVAPDGGQILQQFPTNFPATKQFPRQRENVSYGIEIGGKLGYFRPASPVATNGVAYEGVVGDTSFSLDRGFYDTNIVVAISSSTDGAQIRYTVNGKDPSPTNGTLYTQPILITNTTVLRAMAYKPGWAPTDIDTQTYLYLSNVVKASVMKTSITRHATYGPQMIQALRDVPSISLVTSSPANDTTEVASSFEWLNPDGSPGVHARCGTRWFGGAFTFFEKKSFRLYFRSEYGTSKLRYPVFKGFEQGTTPVEEFDELELRNGSHDMVDRGFYMSNVFTDDTLLNMGRLNPHGRFVHLYLNGTYWGLYHLRERWGAAMHSSYLGGTKEDYESINGNWNVGGWADPGTPYDGDGTTWEKIKGLRRNYDGVKPYLDVPEYIDYMLMWMFGGSEDEYRCVGPKGPGSGFKFYLNDADGWFCGSFYCAAGDRTSRGAPGRSAGDGPGSLFSMLYAENNPEYRILLADRIHAAVFNGGPLTPESNLARLNYRCDQIQRAFYAEAARWLYLNPAEWASRRDEMRRTWLPARTAQALTEWRNAGFYPKLEAPSLSQPGGTVPANYVPEFKGPTNKTIYYTLNGEDPRLPGGAISSEALPYLLTSTNQFLVRTGSTWRWFTDKAGLGRSDVIPGNTNWSAANWKHPEFNDGSWGAGPAELGYGEGDEATLIPSAEGTNRFFTAYFRHAFDVQQPGSITTMSLRLKRDDGAIVYLNGNVVTRSSIASGVVTGSTQGTTAADDGKTFVIVTVSPALLVSGRNVLAVELHQNIQGDDASFDLELIAARPRALAEMLPPLAHSTLIRARTKDGNTWSALNEVFYQVGSSAVGPGEVVVSELNFNPPGADQSEFIELANLSDRAVNLRGARFTNGVEYAFAENRNTILIPGQRLILVNDLFNFQQRYGIGVPVGGSYFGSLNNGGEELTLVGPSAEVIASLRYDGARPWPVEADGGGYTLVLAHPDLGLDNPIAWRTSTSTNGSPADTDATFFTGSPTLDRDSDGLPAIVEYALGTSDDEANSGPGSIVPHLDEQGRFTVTLPRRLSADDARLVVETSSDLAQWTPALLLSTRTLSGGVAEETWGIPNVLPQAFIRVVVRARF